MPSTLNYRIYDREKLFNQNGGAFSPELHEKIVAYLDNKMSPGGGGGQVANQVLRNDDIIIVSEEEELVGEEEADLGVGQDCITQQFGQDAIPMES